MEAIRDTSHSIPALRMVDREYTGRNYTKQQVASECVHRETWIFLSAGSQSKCLGCARRRCCSRRTMEGYPQLGEREIVEG